MFGKPSEEDIKKFSMFLINFIYPDRTSLTISQARSKKWKGMKNKTILCLHQTKIRLSNACLGQTIKLKYGTILQTMMPQLHHGYTQKGLLVLLKPHTEEACPNSLRDLVHDETFESVNDESNDDSNSLCYSSSSDDD